LSKTLFKGKAPFFLPLQFHTKDFTLPLNLYQYAKANPIMFMDPLGLCKTQISIGASSMLVDVNIPLYDKSEFGIQEPNFGVSTTLVGAGLSLITDNPFISRIPGENVSDVYVSVGLGKYLGITYNTDLTRVGLNVGAALALPVSLSTDIETFITGLTN
jgi:hypothetical protein